MRSKIGILHLIHKYSGSGSAKVNVCNSNINNIKSIERQDDLNMATYMDYV